MAINRYRIQQKIVTLSHAAIMDDNGDPKHFSIEDINFIHWEFNHGDGWTTDAWLAESVIPAKNFREAYKVFVKRLQLIVPRASLITQGFISYQNEPFLIHKIGSDLAFFRYAKDVKAVGLMFMENEVNALKQLVKNTTISNAFYYYWNDAVNATGYPSKLLLMFSAIESIVRKSGKTNYALREKILGKRLTSALFGTKGNSSGGLRHRLVHGEYFDNRDSGKNYLELVHNKVLKYFNKSILKKNLLSENVTHPQRHFFGNKEESRSFVRSASGTFSLKEILLDFETNGFRNPKRYTHNLDKKLDGSY